MAGFCSRRRATEGGREETGTGGRARDGRCCVGRGRAGRFYSPIGRTARLGTRVRFLLVVVVRRRRRPPPSSVVGTGPGGTGRGLLWSAVWCVGGKLRGQGAADAENTAAAAACGCFLVLAPPRAHSPVRASFRWGPRSPRRPAGLWFRQRSSLYARGVSYAARGCVCMYYCTRLSSNVRVRVRGERVPAGCGSPLRCPPPAGPCSLGGVWFGSASYLWEKKK
jgi:hypothetical protein